MRFKTVSLTHVTDWVFRSAIADELLPPDTFQILTPLAVCDLGFQYYPIALCLRSCFSSLQPLRDFNRDADLGTRESALSEKVKG